VPTTAALTMLWVQSAMCMLCCGLQVNKATFVRVDYAGDLEEAVQRQIK
jgi:hypothetical protein